MRSGWKSTEFWMHLLSAVAGALYTALSGSTDPTVMVSLQVASAVYTAARTLLKVKDSTNAAMTAAGPAANPALPPFLAGNPPEAK